jgi:hypothetical protein
LVSDNNKPLSLLQLEQMVRGDFGETSVIGVLLVVLVTDVALVARVLGLKVEAGGVH